MPADPFDQFETEVHAAVVAALPEIEAIDRVENIYRTGLKDMREWDKLPYAAILIPDYPDTADSLVADAYMPLVHFYLVVDDAWDVAALRQRLVVLKDYIRDHTFTYCQPRREGRSISTSPLVDPVAKVLSKGLQLSVGRLVVPFKFGTTP